MGRNIKDDEVQFNKALGLVIRVARKKLGVSQRQLAKIVGVSMQQIQKYEAGDNDITVSRFYKMANYLEIPLGMFDNH
jgi:transcriptional regulator with XRE-family HTH domain